ncbi:hypothetical protein GCM10011512_05770 [Tersicoccus solisilvae]|uniref:Uncharacterized protein n=1 Tax=Tersicoccus solisilvae TaxID=1882339 RepID=A0ABQ1NWM5_9MICC|nr:hypothetical protein [Tersicoccus solisilvae]GGC81865.1 hypothetical protein GCM10011512_05770 [Tersicoccus solisilvae]
MQPWLAIAAYVVVAAIWLIPDARFERQLAREADDAATADPAT